MDKCTQVANLFVASLKALAQIHQHNHWTTKGASFYGDHLLFERIYKSALEDLDLAAEKFLGVFGQDAVDYDMQTDLLNKVLSKYKKLLSDPVQLSLTVEKEFIKLCKDAYDCFEKEGKMTLGLDDMVMSISSNREEALYLLQQVLAK